MARKYTLIKQYYEKMQQMHQEEQGCRKTGEKLSSKQSLVEKRRLLM